MRDLRLRVGRGIERKHVVDRSPKRKYRLDGHIPRKVRVVAADGYVQSTAEQVETAREGAVEDELILRVGAGTEDGGGKYRQCLRDRIDGRIEFAVGVAGRGVQRSGVQLQFPLAAKALLQLSVILASLCVVPRPIEGERRAARQARIAAIGIERQTIDKRQGVVPLVAAAHRQQGARREIVFEHAKDLLSLQAREIEKRIPVTENDVQPCAQRPVETKRSRDIRFGTVVVPGSPKGSELCFVGIQRTLANNIHAGAWISQTAKKGIGTAQHFDVVELA